MNRPEYNRLINDPVCFAKKCLDIKFKMMYQRRYDDPRQYDELYQKKPSMLQKGLRRNK